MLVVSRKFGQSVVIGDDIEITVLGIADGVVRIQVIRSRVIPVSQHEHLGLAVDQSVDLEDGIALTIIRLGEGVVRLGISANRAIPVHRKELLEQIKAQKTNTS